MSLLLVVCCLSDWIRMMSNISARRVTEQCRKCQELGSHEATYRRLPSAHGACTEPSPLSTPRLPVLNELSQDQASNQVCCRAGAWAECLKVCQTLAWAALHRGPTAPSLALTLLSMQLPPEHTVDTAGGPSRLGMVRAGPKPDSLGRCVGLHACTVEMHSTQRGWLCTTHTCMAC